MLLPRSRWLAIVMLLSGSLVIAAEEKPADADALFRARDWFGLRAMPATSLNDLQRAAIAAAFLRPDAEDLLRAVIRQDPKSADALEAHQKLSELFVQTGQYRKLAENLDDQQRTFPENPRAARARETLAGFRGLPDQQVIDNKPGNVRHDGGLFVPTTINQKAANYFVDTGAAISSCSESEAKRLGLRFVGGGSLGTSNSRQASFRAAVADEFTLAGLKLKDVAFAVFPDESEPWVHLAEGRRGLIGWHVLIAAHRLRWSSDGNFAFGENETAITNAEPNLCMLNTRPAARVEIAGRTVLFSLDTGAVNTDIYAKFGTEFPALVANGKHTQTEIRSVAGAESHDAISLPEIPLRIGNSTAVLKNATMITRQIGPDGFVGNLGSDILKQTGGFAVDVRTMRVELISR